jgi:hypothetical protein
MPSLCNKVDKPQDINDFGYKLATSPCLFSILVPISRFDTHGNVESNGEAAIDLANGLAPILANVHLVHISPVLVHFFTK